MNLFVNCITLEKKESGKIFPDDKNSKEGDSTYELKKSEDKLKNKITVFFHQVAWILPLFAVFFAASCINLVLDNVTEHKVVFHGNGSDLGSMEAIVIKAGLSASLPLNTFEAINARFLGWATSPAGDVEYTDGASLYMEDADVNLYAVWLRDITLYTLPNSLEPYTGGTPVTAFDTLQYTAAVAWSPVVSGTFTNGTAYTATVTLTPKKNYSLERVPANQFTAPGATSTNHGSGSGVVTAVFPATKNTVSIFALTGLAAPVSGAAVDTSIDATAQFTGSVVWSPAVTGTYAAAKDYTATITLAAKPGFTFSGVGINVFTLAGATTVTNNAHTGVVTATFPSTAESDISDWSITGVTPPAAGNTPVTTFTDTQYTGVIIWSPPGSPFSAATDYTAIIFLFAKSGFTFPAIPANAFTVPIATTANPAGSTMVTAVFPRTASAPNNVTLDPQGGSGGSASVTAYFDQDMPTGGGITAPTRTGYTFQGYYDAIADGTQYYTSGMASAKKWDRKVNGTLYARWQGITYSVSFNGNGNTSGSMPAQNIIYGASQNLSANGFIKTGHTFAGWSTSSGGSVEYLNQATYSIGTGNATLYAKWTPNAYNVNFNADGGSGSMTPQNFVAGETKALSSNSFTRAGYAFNGWATTSGGVIAYANEANYTMGTANATLYAKWAANTYTVNFEQNGGTGTMSAQSFTTGETKSLTNNAFARTGYSFAGWATSSGGTVVYGNGANFTMGSANATLYALWTANNYTVTFDSNGGSGSMFAQGFSTGENKTLTANTFSKSGSSFAGWSTSAGGTVAFGDAAHYTMGTASVTLYAKWTPNSYNITFVPDGGSGSMTDQNFLSGETKALSSNSFTRAGYAFNGWATTSGGAQAYANGANYTMGTANVTLFARWAAYTYTVTFEQNGGVGAMPPQNFLTDEQKALSSNTFTRSGYSFNGWAMTSGGPQAFADGAQLHMGTGNLILFARWAPNTYTVTFDSNGGTGTMSNQIFTYDGVPQNLNTNTFTKPGFTFIGWATTASGSVAYGNGALYTIGASHVTLYAKWKMNIGLNMVLVPPGRFQRDATAGNISVITKPYYIGQYEVTRFQFREVITGDTSDTATSSGLSDPVQNLNTYQMIYFCNKLSLAEGLTPVYTVAGVDFQTFSFSAIPTTDTATWNGATANSDANGYRLPTEMEWLWAAMGAPADGQGGGTNTTGYNKGYAGSEEAGATQTYIANYAWYNNISTTTKPVGMLLNNELDLFDMTGNVNEVCWDKWSNPTGLQTDYVYRDGTNTAIIKGGGRESIGALSLLKYRIFTYTYSNLSVIGFRLARNKE